MKYNFFIFLIILTMFICITMMISPFVNIYPDKMFPFIGFSMFPLSGVIFYYMVNKFYEHESELMNSKDKRKLRIQIDKRKSDNFYNIIFSLEERGYVQIFIVESIPLDELSNLFETKKIYNVKKEKFILLIFYFNIENTIPPDIKNDYIDLLRSYKLKKLQLV